MGALPGSPGGRRGPAARPAAAAVLRARAAERYRSGGAAGSVRQAPHSETGATTRGRHAGPALLYVAGADTRIPWPAARPPAATTARADDRRVTLRSRVGFRPGARGGLLGTRATEGRLLGRSAAE